MKTIVLKRFKVATPVIIFAFLGYFLTGQTISPQNAVSLKLAFDDKIPFIPWTVYMYSWIYTAVLYPLFVIKDDKYFAQLAKAYVFLIIVHTLVFIVYPVTSIGFRPDITNMESIYLHQWAVHLTFYVDPPINLFPSQHLSVACLTFLCVYSIHKQYGLLALPIVLGVLVSILTLKQHFIVDGIAAIILALVAYFIFLYPQQPKEQKQDIVFSRRGPLLYLLFHSLFYLLFSILFILNVSPWK